TIYRRPQLSHYSYTFRIRKELAIKTNPRKLRLVTFASFFSITTTSSSPAFSLLRSKDLWASTQKSRIYASTMKPYSRWARRLYWWDCG
ncbi:tryptophanyl-trna synthetase, partial [Moniliophthora roreri]